MKTTMRTPGDRLRHCLLFEIILLAICVPLLSWVTQEPMEKMGAMSIGLSLMAMVWNGVYNVLFDHLLLRLNRPLYPRSLAMRIGHALLFEAGLLFVTIPSVMWWLEISFVHALMIDLGFVVVTPIYAVAFNGFYDRLFPVAEESVGGCKLNGESVKSKG